jgi:hypothetical protein
MVRLYATEEAMAFIRLSSSNLNVALAAGDGIKKVSESVFKTGPNSEWAKFVVDPHKWLFDHEYRFVDKNYAVIGNGKIPASMELVPVYDSATRMHVRVPFAQTLRDAQSTPLQDEPNYQRQFPAILAHYFMRSCR